MKRKSISVIIGLMSFALLGVMAMQYYFLKESYQLKTQIFDSAVNDALKSVAYKLEKNEAATFLAQKADNDKKIRSLNKLSQDIKLTQKAITPLPSEKTNPIENPSLAFIRQLKKNQEKSDSIFRVRDSILRNKYPNILVYNGPAQQEAQDHVIAGVRFDFEEITDEFGVRQNLVKQVYTERAPNRKRPRRGNVVVDSIKQYVIVDPVLGPVVRTIGKPNYLSEISETELAAAEKTINNKEKVKDVKLYLDSVQKINNKKEIFDDLASEFQQANVPLHKRIKPELLDSLLLIELANNGIMLKYSYQISSNKNSKILFRHASDNNMDFEPENTYKAALFPKDMVREGGYLMVSFPEKNSLILKNMNSILASSVGLLLILTGSFAYTIFSILRQKKISEMKTDFINNMTHEFKTPVATIMIASEALRDPDVNEDRKRVSKLAGIIYDENIRLGDHIERVLNIARIEKDDLKIERKEVNLHDLIHAVSDSMSLQLQKKNAKINMNLLAAKSTILGDELHLSNVFYNLIDNAIKYSKEAPEITINSNNTHADFVITVADNGIGMGRDQQKKIFEQFYRIPTGNLHDVKGFGLGLSYVNNMVKRMGGTIKVKSEKDKGSEFELRFPLA